MNRAALIALLSPLLLAACAAPPAVPVTDMTSRRQAVETVHIVRAGDTLYAIAWAANVDYRQLAAWNGIEPPYVIRPGQLLRLQQPPGHVQAPAVRRQTPASAASVPAPPPTPAAPAAPPAAPSMQPLRWQWPVQGRLLARYAPVQGSQGIDIAGSEGDIVRAAAHGRVVYAGDGLRGYGNLVIVKHDDTLLSAYAHARRLLVEEGAEVDGGQAIAELGATGTDRPKLHFQIRRNGQPVDPLALLPVRGT